MAARSATTKNEFTYAAVTVPATAGGIVIAAANASRQVLRIANVGSQTVYLGDASVATTTGYPLLAGAEYIDVASVTAVYGIVAGTTCEVRYLEIG
ncbi:hypothetical protein CCP3SC15_400013 [Gammaproteobacteria bacterium]